MNATAWSVVGSAVAILVAIDASFRSLHDEIRLQRKRIGALGEQRWACSVNEWRPLKAFERPSPASSWRRHRCPR